MPKRNLTPAYLFFYLLFTPETWRVLLALLFSLVSATFVIQVRPLGTGGQIVLGLMLMGIGWTLMERPGRWIAAFLRKRIVGQG